MVVLIPPNLDIGFDAINDHRSIAGTWIVTLPVGAVTLTLRSEREAGTGNIILNGADSIALTVIG